MMNLRKKIPFILGICIMIIAISVSIITVIQHYESVSTKKDFNSENKILEKIVYLNQEKTISVKIPNSWEYETIDELSDGVLDEIHLYPDKNQKDVYLSLRKTKNPTGVCGTFLTTEKLKLNNGVEATVGYYDGRSNWEFIDISSENLFSWNVGLTEQQSKIGMEILKTISY